MRAAQQPLFFKGIEIAANRNHGYAQFRAQVIDGDRPRLLQGTLDDVETAVLLIEGYIVFPVGIHRARNLTALCHVISPEVPEFPPVYGHAFPERSTTRTRSRDR